MVRHFSYGSLQAAIVHGGLGAFGGLCPCRMHVQLSLELD